VQLLTQQIRGSFEVIRSDPGTSAFLQFKVDPMHADIVFTEPRALIVEDETPIAEELRERLARLGFSVIAAVDSADEGIEIATRERPDSAFDGHPPERRQRWRAGSAGNPPPD
jgi:hypothetical protein